MFLCAIHSTIHSHMTYSAMATKNLDKIRDEVPCESTVAPTELSNEVAKKQTMGDYRISQGVKKYDVANGAA